MKVKFNDLLYIYEKEVKPHTKNKSKIYRFERNKMEYLMEIYDVLSNNTYSKMKYNIFLIYKPKIRVVMSLSIKDKIINHYITRYVLIPSLEKYLDERCVATRVGMGLDCGIKLVKKYIEHFKGKNCYCLKLDISKYFYKIDHDILKSLIKDYLSYEEFKILEALIDSTNESYVNKKIKYFNKDVPLYNRGKGLPIGNMSSQFLAIFYLYKLDHKIVHDYHLKYYVRYMDDFLIFNEDKDYLKEIKVKIEKELKEVYKLDLNKNKSFITNMKDGVVFCGYHFKIVNKKTIIKVSSDTYKRVKRRIKEIKYLYFNKRINFNTLFSSINTYYYGFKYGSNSKIIRYIRIVFNEE